MKLKLYRVTCWHSFEDKEDTFENFVIAGNEVEAKRIVEEEVWTISGIEVKSIEEIDMVSPQLLCSVETDEFEYWNN